MSTMETTDKINTESKKYHFILPNLFTALNMGCGFFAVVLAIKGEYYKACFLVGVGALFDLFDGRVARWTGTQSTFGEQFDSLSDLISFGLAPSMIFYLKFLKNTGRAGIVFAFLYMLCGAFRLARFNANISKTSSDFFQGLPIPGAALGMISFILLSTETGIFHFKGFYLFYVLFYAFLMVSTIPFMSFKNSSMVFRHKKKILLLSIVVLASIIIYEEIILFSLISLYVLASIGYFLMHRKKFKEGLIGMDDDDIL
ncbi:MAG: CDP-diacylglycerol--serine O-phosphatidyltransferase [Halobacteriovoraceae bacterium]|nr:CDP-diacylglycerol--serine O-phosphatidyltransferase [Halobacteriovoraceae bacterium]